MMTPWALLMCKRTLEPPGWAEAEARMGRSVHCTACILSKCSLHAKGQFAIHGHTAVCYHKDRQCQAPVNESY